MEKTTVTKCQCRVVTAGHNDKDAIEFCPLHAAAENLLEAVRETLALWNEHWPGNDHAESERVYNMLRSAFAKAVGGENQRGKGPTYPADKHLKEYSLTTPVHNGARFRHSEKPL